MQRRNVLMIYTGGTIGMVQNHETGAYHPFDFRHIEEQIPDLRMIEANIDTYAFEHPIDSSNVDHTVWARLVDIIQTHYDDYDGFVILHGSDTMAYTASALSFMLENLKKPVVFTGSQLPIGIIRTDGKENLITAIEIAASYRNDEAVVPEVCVYFEYKLYRGNRTHKYNAEQFKAFRSSNYPLLAEAGVRVRFNRPAIRLPEIGPTLFHRGMDNRVMVLRLFPGISESTVKHQLDTPGLRAVVLSTYGSGNAPSAPWFIESLREAIANGLIVINVTQCGEGFVQQGRYETSSGLASAGVMGGADITTEAAITKLMFLLAHVDDDIRLKKLLVQSLRGEMTDDSENE